MLNCPYTNTGFKFRVEYLSYNQHIKQSIDAVYTNGIWYRTSANNGQTWTSWKKTSNVGDNNLYAEGTWSPTSPEIEVGNLTNCKYKKIGKIVFIQAYMELTGTCSSFHIEGLPYPIEPSGDTMFGMTQYLPINGFVDTANIKGVSVNGVTTDNILFSKSITSSTPTKFTIHGYYFTST